MCDSNKILPQKHFNGEDKNRQNSVVRSTVLPERTITDKTGFQCDSDAAALYYSGEFTREMWNEMIESGLCIPNILDPKVQLEQNNTAKIEKSLTDVIEDRRK